MASSWGRSIALLDRRRETPLAGWPPFSPRARSRWLLLLLPLGCPSASGGDTTHGSMSRRARGTLDDGERRGERVRAFLKRDSRTGADTPPHPRIFRLALPLPRSLTFSFFLCHFSPAAYLPLSLPRSLSRVRPFPRSPFSPVPLRRYAPTSGIATVTATTPIASCSLPHSRTEKAQPGAVDIDD